MKKFRDWWDSLDDVWQRIMILNLGLEHEMGGVKNYINDYESNFEKIKSLYEEGALDSYIISKNEITDDTIEKIVNLKTIIFENEGITDLTPLAKLERLEILHCPHNKIINIDPLKDLRNHQELNLAWNNITSVDPLKKLNKLRKLDIWMNNILSLKPIEKLENLEELSCLYNLDQDSWLIPHLSKSWYKLKSLSADEISNIQDLPTFCPALETLYVQGLKGIYLT